MDPLVFNKILTIKQLSNKDVIEGIEKRKSESWNSRRTDWDLLHNNTFVSGLYKCGKCKGNKTTYTQLQIRRADEPMTTYIKLWLTFLDLFLV